MLLETLWTKYQKALATNSTSGSFPAIIPTLTEPTSDGVFNLRNDGVFVPNAIRVMPYAIASDNDTFSMRVYAWDRVGPLGLWVPCVLVELACTASAVVGVAGGDVLATERFADTISLTTGNDDISVDIVSPTGDVAGHAQIDLKGCEKVKFTFKITSGTTSMNALWKYL